MTDEEIERIAREEGWHPLDFPTRIVLGCFLLLEAIPLIAGVGFAVWFAFR